MGCNAYLCTIGKHQLKQLRNEVIEYYIELIRLNYYEDRKQAEKLRNELKRIRSDKNYAIRKHKSLFFRYDRQDGTYITYFPFNSISLMFYTTIELNSYERTIKFIEENKDKIEVSGNAYKELEKFWSKKGNRYIQII